METNNETITKWTHGDGSLGVHAVCEDDVQQVVGELVEVLHLLHLEHQQVLAPLVVAQVANHAHQRAIPSDGEVQ